MRRSICYCDPSQALAGEEGTWKFVYTTAQNLEKGACLKFDLLSKGREIDWELPSHDPKSKSNIIYGIINEKDILHAKPVDVPNQFAPQFAFTLTSDLKAGTSFTVVMGPSPKLTALQAKKATGNTSQNLTQRRRHFLLYVDAKGDGNFADPEIFTMDVKGNHLDRIRIITPSFVTKNKRFDIVIRFEDQFGNLTSNAPEDTLVELTYEQLRENLNWKLFVPETGFVTLPNFYFNEVGTYRIQLENLKTKEMYYSSPMKSFAHDEKNLLWGLLHGESERMDSLDNVENCLRHMRDEQAMNFYASSSFDSAEETPEDGWKAIAQNIGEFNETDRFITYLGSQWMGEKTKEGLRQFINLKDNKALMRYKDSKSNTLKKIYKISNPKDFISIPSFTMGKGSDYDFSDFNPEYEKVVEIYNAWGSSECTAKEGNPLPINGPTKGGVKENAKGSVLAALKRNCRFGFVAGGLDDRGIYANLFDAGQDQYPPGLTAILADEHTRESIFQALHNRSCYATTGKRILLGFYISGSRMGEEISTQTKPGLVINRHISGFVSGTSNVKLIEILRNGEVIQTFEPNAHNFEYTYDDMVDLKEHMIKSKDSSPFVFYYVRVTQDDHNMAWSSPIWIDFVEATKAAKKSSKK
ncbi:MAG: hypothetical protein S4CHLAM6_01050 [Chlamydiae bacterium]|nr:hypothetical protein [Chlamydiota bacterium]